MLKDEDSGLVRELGNHRAQAESGVSGNGLAAATGRAAGGVGALHRIADTGTTQEASTGNEAAALASIHKLFGVTRQLLKEKGRKSETFAKIAIVILNQKIRPFTTDWHQQQLSAGFDDPEIVQRFWRELQPVQQTLRSYAGMLAAMAGVEDFQALVDEPLLELPLDND